MDPLGATGGVDLEQYGQLKVSHGSEDLCLGAMDIVKPQDAAKCFRVVRRGISQGLERDLTRIVERHGHGRSATDHCSNCALKSAVISDSIFFRFFIFNAPLRQAARSFRSPARSLP